MKCVHGWTDFLGELTAAACRRWWRHKIAGGREVTGTATRFPLGSRLPSLALAPIVVRVYDDRPYLTARPDEIARRVDLCPQLGRLPTASPAWNLDRWKAVRDLIVGWYGDDRPDHEAVPDLVELLCGWMDPVQRRIAERLFSGWRAMYPKGDRVVDLDPRPLSVIDHDARVELRMVPTFALTGADGEVELVRLRTGARGSGPDEAAVLHTAGEGDVVFVDAMVAVGAAEEVPEPPDRAERIARMVGFANDAGGGRRVPGIYCFSCASAPRCGQYPLAEPGRIFNSTRSITISKTALDWLSTCQRRVAWDRLHQIPRNREDELDYTGGLATGLLFHEVAASAILSDDPDAVIESACRRVSPSEASELARLWDNHLLLRADDGSPEIRTTEFSAGVTVMVPALKVDSRGKERTEPMAVTFVGILDATGREQDGTPMVIEHRTGKSGEHGRLEAELYAVSAAFSLRSRTGVIPERVAVHLHHLRPDPPRCVRRVFEAADLDLALDSLREAAGVVGGWHPLRTLDPPFSVGPWCDGCHHRELCEEFR